MTVKPRSRKAVPAPEIALRVLAATLGAYAVAYGLTSALAAGLYRAYGDRIDAAIIGTNLALLAFPAISIWAFAERRLARVVLAPPATAVLLLLVALALRP